MVERNWRRVGLRRQVEGPEVIDSNPVGRSFQLSSLFVYH
jgi:hypothetical protein